MVNFLNKNDRAKIIQAIGSAENQTSGEIRVHLTHRSGRDILADAKKVFRRLRMENTRDRNAVLIFVAPLKKSFALYGDEGIHGRVRQEFWDRTRDVMQKHFERGELAEGIVKGVLTAGSELKKFFPIKTNDTNELSNQVTET